MEQIFYFPEQILPSARSIYKYNLLSRISTYSHINTSKYFNVTMHSKLRLSPYIPPEGAYVGTHLREGFIFGSIMKKYIFKLMEMGQLI